MTQSELAYRLGTKQSHISAWECGWFRPRDLDGVVARLREMGARIHKDFLDGFPTEPRRWIRNYHGSHANLGPQYWHPDRAHGTRHEETPGWGTRSTFGPG